MSDTTRRLGLLARIRDASIELAAGVSTMTDRELELFADGLETVAAQLRGPELHLIPGGAV